MSMSICIAKPPLSDFSLIESSLPKNLTRDYSLFSILIADDDAKMRRVLREDLEDFGYFCEEAEDGLQALRQIRTKEYNMVLTDLNMPFLDGLGLAQLIREDSSLGNALVLMMTISRTDMITQLASTFGIQEVLLKPCRASDIDRIIRPQRIKYPWAA